MKRCLSTKSLALLAALLLAAALPVTALAGPPPWAPAHGYRAKHAGCEVHHHYHQYGRRHAGYRAPRVIHRRHGGYHGGYRHGQRQVLGGLAGGALGGYLGSRIGHGDGQLAATAAGAIAGYVIGRDITR